MRSVFLLIALVLPLPVLAQDSPVPAPSFVPEDAALVLFADVTRVRELPAAQELSRLFDLSGPMKALQNTTEKKLLATATSLLLVVPPSEDAEWSAFVVLAMTLEPETLTRAFPKAQQQPYGSTTLYLSDEIALAMHEGHLVIGGRSGVERAIDRSAGGIGAFQSPLAEAVGRANTQAPIWFAGVAQDDLSEKLAAEAPLMTHLESAHGALFPSEGIAAEAHLRFSNVEEATRFHTLFSRSVESASLDVAMKQTGFAALVNELMVTQSDKDASLFVALTADELNRIIAVIVSLSSAP